jgi:hypothetical protein
MNGKAFQINFSAWLHLRHSNGEIVSSSIQEGMENLFCKVKLLDFAESLSKGGSEV